MKAIQTTTCAQCGKQFFGKYAVNSLRLHGQRTHKSLNGVSGPVSAVEHLQIALTILDARTTELRTRREELVRIEHDILACEREASAIRVALGEIQKAGEGTQ